MALQQDILQAIQTARQTGQPIVIPGSGGLVATPQGSTRMATPMELQRANIPFQGALTGASAFTAPTVLNQPNPFQRLPTIGMPGTQSGNPVPIPPASALPSIMHSLAGPNMQVTNAPTGSTVTAPGWLTTATPSGWDLGMNAGIPLPPVNVQANANLNQVNPNVQTYAGQPGWGGVPQAAVSTVPLAAQAARYRVQHGVGSTLAQDRMTTDQLNAMSLRAAQAGRTYWAPGTQVAAGQFAPNLLQAPPSFTPDNLHWQLAQNEANQLQQGGTY